MGNCVGGKGKKDPTILTEEEIKLLLENTKLNRAQINALHQNFLKECPSGKLTKKDFVKLFKEVHPSDNKKEKADKFCEYVFKVIDRDSLGYISFNDFVLCFSLTSYGDFKAKCDFAFKLYDLDRDNKISKKEMTQVLVALYDLSGITDRKKDKSPAKKVEEIMNHINAQTEAAAPEVAEPEAKGKKAAKKEKPKNFITRDQFISACTEDEALKKLFVDSIFAATSAEPVVEETAVVVGSEPVATVVVEGEPTAAINLGTLDAPAFEVTTTSKVECVEFTSSDAPVEAEPAAEATVEAATVEVAAAAAVEEAAAPAAEESPADQVFKALDTNNDGKVDIAEFKAAVASDVAEIQVTEVKSDEKTAAVEV